MCRLTYGNRSVKLSKDELNKIITDPDHRGAHAREIEGFIGPV